MHCGCLHRACLVSAVLGLANVTGVGFHHGRHGDGRAIGTLKKNSAGEDDPPLVTRKCQGEGNGNRKTKPRSFPPFFRHGTYGGFTRCGPDCRAGGGRSSEPPPPPPSRPSLPATAGLLAPPPPCPSVPKGNHLTLPSPALRLDCGLAFSSSRRCSTGGSGWEFLALSSGPVEQRRSSLRGHRK